MFACALLFLVTILAAADGAEDCWWTGCQPSTWAITGCKHYDRREVDRRPCKDGHEFNCCAGADPSTTVKPADITDGSCWWTGCQKKDWAVRGCEQYEKVEMDQRTCEGGTEYHCCDPSTPEPPASGGNPKEECWWSSCMLTNTSSFICPEGLRRGGSEYCGEGETMFECCGKVPIVKKSGNKTLLTGESFEDFVKYLFMKVQDFSLKPDNIRCDLIDPGKKHMLKIKNEGIRICDLCPHLPQKHLLNVFLDRVPSGTQSNLQFHECFGLCYEEKTCMALSYDHSTSTCYIFDSTAGGYVEESGWTSVLMTQPSGVVLDWSYTRHTRLIGQLQHSSIQPSFLHCLDKCDNLSTCNFASFNTGMNNCSLFSDQKDLVYVDLVYGHLAGTRVSYNADSQPVDERFVHEGEELSVRKTDKADFKCGHMRNETHGGYYSEPCLVSGSLLGCEQATGCKACYYPENTLGFDEKLGICPDSEYDRLSAVKASILTKMETCLADQSCVGVGYKFKTEQISTMKFLDYIEGDYDTLYMLRIPAPGDSKRQFLGAYDLVAHADIKPISTVNPSGFRELKNLNFENCVNEFTQNKRFTRMAYSHQTRTCKMGTERTAFVRDRQGQKVVAFKRPSLLSSALNYLRTPGFSIISGTPRATDDRCLGDCEESCSRQCSTQYGAWCIYISIQMKPNGGAKCVFYDDDSNFKFQAEETSLILTQVSSLDFSLASFDKLDSFQSSDIYNCFGESNQQTQTSLTVYQGDNTASPAIRGRRGIKDFFKKIGKGIVDGVKSVGRAIVDTGKGVVNTVKNLAKGDLKAAGESFKKIPVVDLAKNTVELGGAVITGDWDKAKKKGKEILESDAFELVTTVALPGAGKIVTTGVKAGIKGLAQAGKKSATTIAKGGKNKIDDVAKDSRKVKNNKKDDRPKEKKKDEKIEKERGEKCDKRSKRATNPPRKRGKPGDCKDNKKKVKCDKPKKVTYVIGKTLDEFNNRDPGDKGSYECKPGYREEKTTAVCTKKGNDGVWEPKPKCLLETCPNTNKAVVVLNTPQAEAFGTRFGDFITAYVVLFDKQRKLPVWSVALHQSSQFQSKNYNAAKVVKRNSGFTVYPCAALKDHQATNADYSGSGTAWHKGHLTPANVARWSEKAKRLSNLYINAAPQNGHTNSGPWNGLEAHVYCFSKRVRTIVATGICSSSLPKKVGKIPIPECFWKMACYRDENSNYQVVGFYTSNSAVSGDTEEAERADEVFTPLSQNELKLKIKGGFEEVWVKPARHLSSGRPVAIGGDSGTWFPLNILGCRDAVTLSKDEKDAWQAAFDESKHELKRGKNTKDDENDSDGDSDNDRRRRRRAASAKISRGCHGSELKNALDETGFFIPYSETDDVSDSDSDEGVDKDDGDGSVKVSVQKCGKRIVGYYTSWGEKTIAGLELQRLTHVIYAFLEMHADGSISIGSADRKNAADADKETAKAKQRLENLMESAKRYPHIKVMFAVGGWENSQYFSSVAASPNMRLTFIASVIRMIEEYGFDGVDVDWEYPVTGGAEEGVPADKQNYVLLMKELRTAFDGLAAKVGRKDKFLISFAGAAGQWTLDPGYDLPGLFKYADFVNIMSYDYFGAWASKWGAYTGPPSPLYFGMPPGFSGKTNVDWTVKHYTCKTKQPHKINMGVPFYGRYWKNVGDSVDGKDEMWRTASSVNGKFEGGYVPWYKVKSDYLKNGAFQKKFHEKSKTPYAWNPTEKIFMGYENKESLEHKIKYAVDKNVGGLMIWALELDDNDLTLLNTIAKAPLCQRTDPTDVNHKCSPIDDKRWWTPEDGVDKAGLCGRSAPLYKGFYPVCDPDDPGYSCCGAAGYCGTGPKYCDCPTCKNYREDPKTILEEPTKPSIPITWYLLNDPDGKRGQCGRKIPKIGSVYPTCNPDDDNSFCCSNGGYCGNTDAHCKCDGCIDFRKNPKYQFGPKKWWTLEDGEDLGGRCGPKAPKVGGVYEAECEGSSRFHCCSPNGWCGSGSEFCECKGCKNFKGKN